MVVYLADYATQVPSEKGREHTPRTWRAVVHLHRHTRDLTFCLIWLKHEVKWGLERRSYIFIIYLYS